MKTNEMKLLIVAGFFGCGKTTFIIKSAKKLVKKHKEKVAIIVNDIGEIGIDDKVIQSYGLRVKELFGGCVCCQLGDDLTETLRRVKKAYKPNIAILEPSGAADPAQLLSAVNAVRDFETFPLLTIVDATQFMTLLSEMPIAARKVAYADTILINKIDAVSRKRLLQVETEVKRINKNAKVYSISAHKDTNIDKVLITLVR
ncbi:MAG: GTP-binding protein [Candidatus Bathyarchaeia archaeon]